MEVALMKYVSLVALLNETRRDVFLRYGTYVITNWWSSKVMFSKCFNISIYLQSDTIKIFLAPSQSISYKFTTGNYTIARSL